ncbi:MAG: 1-acyl-sn-glycerol-3-phosphate acyltransferase [Proteobacteria bacterium]|jgi:1-acyl-sn-glycerol-3-phosphate acyltransferase|nr:1-acyl-sn-glycerol-3-phosphate acyltransferase [Pseudomonadota bacterium]
MKALFLLRSMLATSLFLVWTFVCSITVLLETLFLRKRNLEDLIILKWAQISVALYNVRLRVEGRENIPQGSALLLFNHTSFFDVLALAAAVPGLRFGAKIELFKIPFFGAAMERAGSLPIARHNREEVFQVYEKTKERVARGEKFALSPEGGRNFEEELLPFKAGPFVFAIQSGMPIVPVVILGAKATWPKGTILANSDAWKRTIDLVFLKTVSVEGKTFESRKELQTQVRNLMLPYFSKHPISESKKNPV